MFRLVAQKEEKALVYSKKGKSCLQTSKKMGRKIWTLAWIIIVEIEKLKKST